MNETTSPVPTPASPNASSLVNLGGMLGIGACCIGILIFLGACLGYDRFWSLAWIPMILAGGGLTVTVVGGILRHGGVEHTSVPAAVFINVFGLIGGLLEMAMWLDWPIFHRPLVQ